MYDPQLLSARDLELRAPDLYALYCIYKETMDDDADEDECGDEDDSVFIYLDGDAHLSTEQYHTLLNEFGHYTPLAVDGNLNVAGRFSSDALVNGNLCCDTFYGGDGMTQVKGTVFARHHAVFMAEDHEVLCRAGLLSLDTPYVFSWFFDLSGLQLSAHTVIFLLCDYSAYKNMRLTNPHFFWQDDIFVLKPELCYVVGCRYSDAPYWNLDTIAKLQQTGQSLFIDGFDISSLSLCRQATQHAGQKQYAEAFTLYQQALAISPNYYFAWLESGRMLFLSGAYGQAINYFEKASNLFPEKQKDLNNRAADYIAMSCVRLRRLDEAIRWATFSIDSSKNNRLDTNLLYFGYRIRAEAYLLQNQWDKAKDDLEHALNMSPTNGSANWLMGLVYHHFANAKKANLYHRIAQKTSITLSASYDTHTDADFFYKQSITLDWPDWPQSTTNSF